MIQPVLSPTKSMRKYCLVKCEIEKKRVRLCKDTECPLHPYRLGKQPNRAGIGGQRASFRKNANSSGGSAGHLGAREGFVALGHPGPFSEEASDGKTDLNARGRIKIVRLGDQGLVITLTTETSKEVQDAEVQTRT